MKAFIEQKKKEYLEHAGWMRLLHIDSEAMWNGTVEPLLTEAYRKGIEDAIKVIENNPCDADGYHYCSQQDVYKSQLEKLKGE